MASRRFYPIGPVRADVERLVKRYGSLGQAAEATGIPYRTLQGVAREGKLDRVTVRTAERIQEAAANPPDVEVPGFWNKRYLPVEELRPLVLDLEARYGSITQASGATGLAIETLRSIKGRYKAGVRKDIAEKIKAAHENPPDIHIPNAYELKHVDAQPVADALGLLEGHYHGLPAVAQVLDMPLSTLRGIKNLNNRGVMHEIADKIIEAAANPPDVEVLDRWEKMFVPSEKVAPSVEKLVEHYGDLHSVSEVLQIPPGTLYNIRYQKSRGVRRATAAKIVSTAKNPPDVRVLSHWEKRYVARERLLPLVLFLERVYDGIPNASQAIGVSMPVLRSIKRGPNRGIKKESAVLIVEAVKALRHGDRTWSVYENDGPPRLATKEEQMLPKSFTRWRHAGGKTK